MAISTSYGGGGGGGGGGFNDYLNIHHNTQQELSYQQRMDYLQRKQWECERKMQQYGMGYQMTNTEENSEPIPKKVAPQYDTKLLLTLK